MTTSLRLTLFTALLAVVFVAALALGAALRPFGDASPATSHDQHGIVER
jgi:hypothetical protein